MFTMLLTLLAVLICWIDPLSAMTFDNRHFPLLDKPIVLRHDDAHAFLRAQPFLMVSNGSFDDDDEDEDSGGGLFETMGKYDQKVLNDALLRSGRISESILSPTILSEFKGGLPWSMRGKFDAFGSAFTWYQALGCNWQIGGSLFVMGVRSRLEMVLRKESAFTRGLRHELYQDNEKMRIADDVTTFFWDKAGFSDLDFYIRFGTLRHYEMWTRTIDAGLKLGFIAPTGVRYDIDNPASLPFGGNGHWGIYVDGSLGVELKEDIFAGLTMRVIKRLPKTSTIRMPLALAKTDDPLLVLGKNSSPEPNSFGVIKGTARIDPGVTFVFAPYATFAGLRGGFGGQLGYTLIMHGEDDYRNLISDTKVDIAVGRLRERSEWNSEYVSCSLVYDCGYDKEVRGALPLISFDVDIPVHFLASKRSNKTIGISLRIESDLW